MMSSEVCDTTPLTLENAEEVASQLRQLLYGKMFSVTCSHGICPEVTTSVTLLDPGIVVYRFHETGELYLRPRLHFWMTTERHYSFSLKSEKEDREPYDHVPLFKFAEEYVTITADMWMGDLEGSLYENYVPVTLILIVQRDIDSTESNKAP